MAEDLSLSLFGSAAHHFIFEAVLSDMRVSRIVGLYISTIDFSCLFYSLPQPWSLHLYNVFSGIPVSQPFKIWTLVFAVVFLLQIDNHCLSVGTFCSPSPWDTPEERVPVLMLLSVTPNYSVFSLKPSRLFSTSHLYHISSPLCHQPYFLVVLTGHRHFLCSQHPWLIKHNLSYRNWCLWIENENNGAAGVGGCSVHPAALCAILNELATKTSNPN